MAGERQVNWKTLFIEGTAIIVSILLAFAIDAWWQDRERAEDERESLELISRDLRSSIEQLELAKKFARTSADAALQTYVSLSMPGARDGEALRVDIIKIDRRTLRLPRAAYTDLISTGNLRVVDDRDLRDAIIRFYETVDRFELVVLENNRAFLDGQLQDALYGAGLMFPHRSAPTGLDTIDDVHEMLLARLPADFKHPPEPLWSLEPNAREWDRIRAATMNAAIIHTVGELFSTRLIERASELDARIQAWLGQNGGAAAPLAAE